LSKYPYLDAERVAGLGGSYGGFMANWLNGHSKKFKALVNHDGVFSTTQVYFTTGKYRDICIIMAFIKLFCSM
jgi:acylaminoacyl-peptidase